MKNLFLILLMAFATVSLHLRADQNTDIRFLQTRWAEIKYQLPENQRVQAFESLVTEAEKMRNANPDKPDYLIWEAIIRSTYAGEKGGLGALSQVKQAKKLFEKSISLQPDALDGSAYTSLGSLYYQVPGWPIGFGDNDKAREMLLKGLRYNPDGIDSNYFYGDYLMQQKQYKDALTAFEKALKAPARPGRESADKGRKAEIQTAIAKVKKELS